MTRDPGGNWPGYVKVPRPCHFRAGTNGNCGHQRALWTAFKLVTCRLTPCLNDLLNSRSGGSDWPVAPDVSAVLAGLTARGRARGLARSVSGEPPQRGTYRRPPDSQTEHDLLRGRSPSRILACHLW
jgi:hypothetical protein